MADDALMEQLAAIASRQGFSWSYGAWPGKDGMRPAANCVDDLTHEIAHWMVATQRERPLPWFGLGHPSGFGPGVCGPKTQSDREHAASLLGIALLWWTTGDRSRVESLLSQHSWPDDGPAHFRLLRRRGLVVGRSLWESWPGPRWSRDEE